MKRTDELPIEQIRLDGGTQSRAQINMAVVAEYAEEMQAGAQFPRPTVFHDGQSYWLVDGFHRLYAHKQAFPEYPMWCEVQDGTQQEAIWESLKQNLSHGLRRTNADKRKAVETALIKFTNKSDREIAAQCGASHPTVINIRKELELSGKIYQIEARTVTRGGTTYTQKAKSTPEAKYLVADGDGWRDRSTNQQMKKSGYPCWTCGEVLDSEQWHCETCDEHWPTSVNHCSTCYAAPLLPEEQPENEAAPLITDELRARAEAARQAIPLPIPKTIPTGITTQWLDDICKLQMRVAGTKLDTLSEAVTQWADDDLQKGIRECDRFISIFQTWRSVFTSESQSRGIYEQEPKVRLRPVSTITNEFSAEPKPEHPPQLEGEKLLKRGRLLLRQGQKPECDLSKFRWSVIRFREKINDNRCLLSPKIKSELESMVKELNSLTAPPESSLRLVGGAG